jgi:uncharacterized protein
MAALVVAAGLMIGLSLGALGGGGSILAVPVLVYLLGQSPHQATTISLLVVGIAASAGTVTHARADRVRLREGAIFGVLGMAGSYLGSRASAAFPANALLAGFGILMVAVAAAMIVRRKPRPHAPDEDQGVGHEPPEPRRTLAPTAARGWALHGGRHPLLVATAATAVGLITGFFGVGGGFVVVPALVLILGFDMPAAVGTSLVIIAINSGTALATRAAHGGLGVDWPVIIGFTVAAVAGALGGGRLAGRASPQRLNAAFTVLIVAVAGYTLARSLPALA